MEVDGLGTAPGCPRHPKGFYAGAMSPEKGRGGGCTLDGDAGGGFARVEPAMVWAGAWLGPTLATFVPPFGRGGWKRAQVFHLRKPVVFGCTVAWVMDVAPGGARARDALTPYAVAL